MFPSGLWRLLWWYSSQLHSTPHCFKNKADFCMAYCSHCWIQEVTESDCALNASYLVFNLHFWPQVLLLSRSTYLPTNQPTNQSIISSSPYGQPQIIRSCQSQRGLKIIILKSGYHQSVGTVTVRQISTWTVKETKKGKPSEPLRLIEELTS